jgi:hypothetical protein
MVSLVNSIPIIVVLSDFSEILTLIIYLLVEKILSKQLFCANTVKKNSFQDKSIFRDKLFS